MGKVKIPGGGTITTWGPTIKGEKPWPKAGTIVILVHDDDYVDHTRSRKSLSREQLRRIMERLREKRI